MPPRVLGERGAERGCEAGPQLCVGVSPGSRGRRCCVSSSLSGKRRFVVARRKRALGRLGEGGRGGCTGAKRVTTRAGAKTPNQTKQMEKVRPCEVKKKGKNTEKKAPSHQKQKQEQRRTDDGERGHEGREGEASVWGARIGERRSGPEKKNKAQNRVRHGGRRSGSSEAGNAYAPVFLVLALDCCPEYRARTNTSDYVACS